MSATSSSESARGWRRGARVLVRGRRWRVEGITDGTDCTALRLRDVDRDTGFGTSLTILTPFDRPMPVECQPRPLVVRPRRWMHDLDRALLDVRPFGSLAATARTPIRLMPHQLEPALAVLRHGTTRLLLADGVGLGKTIEAGIILLELMERRHDVRAIVLVPAGLRDQWSSELHAHFQLTVIAADSIWLRNTAAERPPDVNPWSLPGIYVASHDFVKRPEVLRPLEDVTWDVAIVDEAHAAATGTDRRAAIHAIACRARRVILLTATPHADDPVEFAALCQIGCIGDREPAHLFARSREDVAGGRPRKSVVLAVAPSETERRMHLLLHRYSMQVWKEAALRNDDRARLASIVLRKRALSSAASLAASVQRRIALLSQPSAPQPEQLRLGFADEDPLDDDVPDGALAAPGLTDPRRERRWLAAIGEAAQLASRAESKTRRLLRLLDRLREPAIVFTEYRDTLARLERRIASAGRATVSLHGGMSPSERGQAVVIFNDGETTLLATDAAAEGLNLHHRCRIIIHYELPWNPARLEQRAGRVDRLGQAKRVHEIALVAADTAERLVIAPLTARSLRRSIPLTSPSVHTHATRASRLLDALTESRVAEAVMAGVPVVTGRTASICTSCDDVVEEDLRTEAADEARRLEEERARIARSQLGPQKSSSRTPFVSEVRFSTQSADIEEGLVLVYVAALETEDGRRLHAETIGIHVPIAASLRDSKRRAQLRQLVRPFVELEDRQLIVWIERMMAERLLRASAQHDRLRCIIESRDDAMRRLRALAARRLVQPGLFDRRSDRSRESSGSLVDDSLPSGNARVRTEITLLAALLVTVRARSS